MEIQTVKLIEHGNCNQKGITQIAFQMELQ